MNIIRLMSHTQQINGTVQNNTQSDNTSWRHQVETYSTLLALCDGKPPVNGGFPSQRPVTQSFDVFFDFRLNKRVGKQ